MDTQHKVQEKVSTRSCRAKPRPFTPSKIRYTVSRSDSITCIRQTYVHARFPFCYIQPTLRGPPIYTKTRKISFQKVKDRQQKAYVPWAHLKPSPLKCSNSTRRSGRSHGKTDRKNPAKDFFFFVNVCASDYFSPSRARVGGIFP
jgi:hypothetical protein